MKLGEIKLEALRQMCLGVGVQLTLEDLNDPRDEAERIYLSGMTGAINRCLGDLEARNALPVKVFALTEETASVIEAVNFRVEFDALKEQVEATARDAHNAARSIEGMTADAQSLPAGQQAKATVTGGSGTPYSILFGIPRGQDGTNGIDGTDGTDGITPHIGDNMNWFIGSTDTGIRAQGTDGTNGIDGTDGTDGITPHIGGNGNWFIGSTDTGVHAQGADGTNGIDGTDGTDGITPHIGGNGNWFIGSTDTGVHAQGAPGVTPDMSAYRTAAEENLLLAQKQDKKTVATVTLTTAGWSSKTQTVSTTGVTASNTVIVSPAPSSHIAYGEAGIYCSAQAAGSLTFKCENVPTGAITVNVVIFN